MTFEDILPHVFRFTSFDAAQSFAWHATKTMLILHGDSHEYWVTHGRYASWLERHGYEIVG